MQLPTYKPGETPTRPVGGSVSPKYERTNDWLEVADILGTSARVLDGVSRIISTTESYLEKVDQQKGLKELAALEQKKNAMYERYDREILEKGLQPDILERLQADQQKLYDEAISTSKSRYAQAQIEAIYHPNSDLATKARADLANRLDALADSQGKAAAIETLAVTTDIATARYAADTLSRMGWLPPDKAEELYSLAAKRIAVAEYKKGIDMQIEQGLLTPADAAKELSDETKNTFLKEDRERLIRYYKELDADMKHREEVARQKEFNDAVNDFRGLLEQKDENGLPRMMRSEIETNERWNTVVYPYDAMAKERFYTWYDAAIAQAKLDQGLDIKETPLYAANYNEISYLITEGKVPYADLYRRIASDYERGALVQSDRDKLMKDLENDPNRKADPMKSGIAMIEADFARLIQNERNETKKRALVVEREKAIRAYTDLFMGNYFAGDTTKPGYLGFDDAKKAAEAFLHDSKQKQTLSKLQKILNEYITDAARGKEPKPIVAYDADTFLGLFSDRGKQGEEMQLLIQSGDIQGIKYLPEAKDVLRALHVGQYELVANSITPPLGTTVVRSPSGSPTTVPEINYDPSGQAFFRTQVNGEEIVLAVRIVDGDEHVHVVTESGGTLNFIDITAQKTPEAKRYAQLLGYRRIAK